jgi:hypothetical protein
MSQITIDIKGRSWTFQLIPDKRFDKLHNQDGENRSGMTIFGTYSVHFRKSDWCLVDIRHEIGHILYFMSLNASSDLTSNQVEESMCSIIGTHAPEIILWSDRVAECFFRRE